MRVMQTGTVGYSLRPRMPDAPDKPPFAPTFEDVYLEHFAYVWHSLRRLGIAVADLPDATHDAFIAVHRSLAKYDPARPVRPWLFGIAFRVASDRRQRDRSAREVVHEAMEIADTKPLADQQLSDEQTRAIVLEALTALDVERRAVIILHDIDEVPIAEIARVLEVPDKTLYSRLRIAREQFAAAIRRAKLRHGER